MCITVHSLENLKKCNNIIDNKMNFVVNPLTLSDPIFLPTAYSPALIYFGQERGWWITCNYPTVLKKKNRNRKSTTCAICSLKSILLEEKEWNRKIVMSDEVRHRIGKG
jgi:hypothetical protein